MCNSLTPTTISQSVGRNAKPARDTFNTRKICYRPKVFKFHMIWLPCAAESQLLYYVSTGLLFPGVGRWMKERISVAYIFTLFLLDTITHTSRANCVQKQALCSMPIWCFNTRIKSVTFITGYMGLTHTESSK